MYHMFSFFSLDQNDPDLFTCPVVLYSHQLHVLAHGLYRACSYKYVVINARNRAHSRQVLILGARYACYYTFYVRVPQRWQSEKEREKSGVTMIIKNAKLHNKLAKRVVVFIEQNKDIAICGSSCRKPSWKQIFCFNTLDWMCTPALLVY